MTTTRMTILHKYILKQFLVTLAICLLASTSLFLVFDFFERINTFVKEDTTIWLSLSYALYKIPFIINLMTPVAVLVSTLIAVGKLAQNSEITAMRACGVSLFWLCKPLLYSGLVISLVMLVASESIVPLTIKRSQEIYTFDVKKRDQRGNFSRSNFWYRSGKRFYNAGMYDSRNNALYAVTIYEFDDSFNLRKRVDAQSVSWEGDTIGWSMKDVVEVSFDATGKMNLNRYAKLPLVIEERPKDFYDLELRPETMNFFELKTYIDKLEANGAIPAKHIADLHAKIAFPFVNFIVVLIAFPFSLSSARSGSMTTSFVAGVSIGFGYYFVHAFCLSLGGAELIPVIPAAWAANIILGSLGAYRMLGTES